MIAGAVQAVRTDPRYAKNQGIQDLDPDVDEQVLGLYRRHGPKDPAAVDDPERWTHRLLALARRFQVR
jgi:hypothetical protein